MHLGKTAIVATLVSVSLASTPALANVNSAPMPEVSSAAHQELGAKMDVAQADGNVTEEEQVEVIAGEMQFIFDEATSVSANGEISADYQSLIDRFGEEGAQNALAFVYAEQGKSYEETRAGIKAEIQQVREASGPTVTPYSAYSDCILEKSGFASIVSLTNGTLTAYLNDKNWTEAGKLIVKAAAKNAVKLTGVGVVATLTAAAGWCAFSTR